MQGSQRHGKSWKTWKMKKAFSRPGKIMEFKKKAKIMEKSWNFKMSLWKNHGNFFWAARTLSKKNFALCAHIPMMITELVFV